MAAPFTPSAGNGPGPKMKHGPSAMLIALPTHSTRIGEGNWEDSDQKQLEQFVKEFTDDFGCDLDEEGQPIERGESDRVKERRADQDGGARREEQERSEEETREEEPARA